MGTLKVTNEVKVYEIDGKEVQPKVLEDAPKLIVGSHWNRDNFVVLKVPGAEKSVSVSARDLKAAIDNATNTNRHG